MGETQRVQAVAKSFGRNGARLVHPDRVLIKEGQLMKQSRRKPQPKAFFLFNDILVYGSIVINGRWFKNLRIIPLGDIELEDLEDGYMTNQWLIKTPRKTSYVSTASSEEKQAWIKNIQICKSRLPENDCSPTLPLIPDRSSAVCMRCFNAFTFTHRRHHCRKCGFLVCGRCSKNRAVIKHIHPTQRLRVCVKCHTSITEKEEGSRFRKNSTGLGSDEEEPNSFEDENNKTDYKPEDHYNPVSWIEPEMSSPSPYVYLKPMYP